MTRRADPERRVFWRQLIEEQADSGLSVAIFCWQRDVSTASFYNWKRRLCEPSSTQAAATTRRDGDENATARFVAIDLPSVSSVPSTHCEVLLMDGRRVWVPVGFDQDSLINLFAALGATT